MSASPIVDPVVAADAGEAIYRDRYQERYEREYPGMFVAIDISTQETSLADTPEDALGRAYAASPGGFFHLIQVGHVGAFRVGYTRSPNSMDWLLR